MGFLKKVFSLITKNTSKVPSSSSSHFLVDPCLEEIVWEYALAKSTTVSEAIGGDGRDGEKFKNAHKKCAEIIENFDEELSRYLKPYFGLNMSKINHRTEWHRWYSANDFKK